MRKFLISLSAICFAVLLCAQVMAQQPQPSASDVPVQGEPATVVEGQPVAPVTGDCGCGAASSCNSCNSCDPCCNSRRISRPNIVNFRSWNVGSRFRGGRCCN